MNEGHEIQEAGPFLKTKDHHLPANVVQVDVWYDLAFNRL